MTLKYIVPIVVFNISNSNPLRGAFCEAKVRSVVKQVKVRVAFRGSGNGTALLSSEYVRLVGKAASAAAEGAAAGAAAAAGDVLAQLTVGAAVQARHPDKQEYLDATVSMIMEYLNGILKILHDLAPSHLV